ncbi:hypothetical protein CYMTET_2562 [Cymbomonas tetramitiformis]|uniref:Uncharacterized protein n=1 Tax=Cymbomonas tetramitiformis TaxID=36881 RepID=A0AAE0H528_9CHLO|nr:hypothetical protein CYMTET_2562 [Cymbomonas tetramitiformis]
MKRSGFDPPPPAKPKIHLTVMPRRWWDAIFAAHGCAVNVPVRALFEKRQYHKATFFPYICKQHRRPPVSKECLPAVLEAGACVSKNGGNVGGRCEAAMVVFESACHEQ